MFRLSIAHHATDPCVMLERSVVDAILKVQGLQLNDDAVAIGLRWAVTR